MSHSWTQTEFSVENGFKSSAGENNTKMLYNLNYNVSVTRKWNTIWILWELLIIIFCLAGN